MALTSVSTRCLGSAEHGRHSSRHRTVVEMQAAVVVAAVVKVVAEALAAAAAVAKVEAADLVAAEAR